MRHSELPRVLRRAVGLMRFAREATGASAASLFGHFGAEAAAGAEAGWFETRGIASTVCVPLVVPLPARPASMGVLFFDFTPDRSAPLSRAELALLSDVGRRCARALSRAADTLPALEPRRVH